MRCLRAWPVFGVASLDPNVTYEALRMSDIEGCRGAMSGV